jgi:hypothetical protein
MILCKITKGNGDIIGFSCKMVDEDDHGHFAISIEYHQIKTLRRHRRVASISVWKWCYYREKEPSSSLPGTLYDIRYCSLIFFSRETL